MSEISGRTAPAPREETSPAVGAATPLSNKPEDLEAQIEQTRLQLAATIDEIADRVHPKNVARRAVERARTVMVDEYGELRPDRVAMVAGVAVGLVGLLLLRRARSRR